VNLVDSSAWLEYFADGPNAAYAVLWTQDADFAGLEGVRYQARHA
jgi:hypothetical protein